MLNKMDIISDLVINGTLDKCAMNYSNRNNVVKSLLKSEIIYILIDMSDEKFFEAYDNGHLIKKINTILYNLKISKNTNFYKQFKNLGFTKKYEIKYDQVKKDDDDVLIDIFDLEYSEEEELEYDHIRDEKELKVVDIVEEVLNGLKGLKGIYNRGVWRMYSIEGMTITEISNYTGIGYHNIRNSVFRVREMILKKCIENGINY